METLSAVTEAGRYPSSGRSRHLPMSQRVYLTLREMLMVGAFKPGESVSLRTLAARLGTSPMPVREAVNRLIAEQALQMLPNRQVIVPQMSKGKFQELWRIRQLLEGMAAETASDMIEPAVMEELERLNGIALAAISRQDPDAILVANKDFHFCLYEASRSEVLIPMIEGLWMQMGPFMRLSLAAKKTSWNGAEHIELLSALKRRDRAAVGAAVWRDVSSSAEILMKINLFDA